MEPVGLPTTHPPDLAFTSAERLELMAALNRRLRGNLPPPRLEIHREDHMFRFLLDHHKGFRELALVDYFRSGWSVARLLRQVLAWRFGEGRGGIRLLDFASGFGRATRFYLDELPAPQIWVSDLFPEAVVFQRQLLGVEGFASTAEPASLHCDLRFDAIMVASLFSHLPKATFLPWLSRLVELVAPGGLLLVSVDDEALLPPDRSLEDGFCYQASVEIPDLDPKSYGVSWVTEDFMARAIANATRSRGPASWWRVPRALWSYQDLYVIAPDVGGPTAPPTLRPEPVGALYDCSLDVDGRCVDVRGWAAETDGSNVERVEISIQGHCQTVCTPQTTSTAVDRFLGSESGQPVEWACTLRSPDFIPPDTLLAVEVLSRSGERFLVHLGSLESTQLYLRCLQESARSRRLEETLQEERLGKDGVIHELEARLKAMEASRFWRLRNLWWQARRAIGLGKELPGRPATRR